MSVPRHTGLPVTAVPDLSQIAARARMDADVQSRINAAPQFNYDTATWFDRFDAFSRNVVGFINNAKMALGAGDAAAVMLFTSVAQAEAKMAELCLLAHLGRGGGSGGGDGEGEGSGAVPLEGAFAKQIREHTERIAAAAVQGNGEGSGGASLSANR